MKNIRYFFLLLVMILFAGCISAGTHGSLKCYKYNVKKSVLQKTIEKVIANNKNIKRSDITQKDYIIDVTKGTNDTIPSNNHFNDGVNYVTIKIDNRGTDYEYTIQYVGDQSEWLSSKSSYISIAYAYDEEGNGGSDGNGNFPWYKPLFKKKILDVFEREFIENIDTELRIKK